MRYVLFVIFLSMFMTCACIHVYQTKFILNKMFFQTQTWEQMIWTYVFPCIYHLHICVYKRPSTYRVLIWKKKSEKIYQWKVVKNPITYWSYKNLSYWLTLIFYNNDDSTKRTKFIFFSYITFMYLLVVFLPRYLTCIFNSKEI